jgi:tetratricopeptide (TPR) repeat protein
VITKIDQALSVGPGPHIAVIRGIGGQGKSQVAMEYCHRERDGPSPDIFWIDATSENSVTSTFVSISGLISTETDHLLNSDARIAFVRRKFASWSTGLLLVFDNYDNPHDFSNIRDFFPPNNLSSILVTGRHADIDALVLGQGANLIELSGLGDVAAVELLEHHSQVTETNSKFGEEIVRRLGYHPLAITQAGSYIRKGGIQLGEFMGIYKQEKEEILKNTTQLSQYRRRLGDTEKETSLNVFTTWQLSFQQLLSQTSEDSTAVKLLRLLAFFDNNDISEWIFIESHRDPFHGKIFKLIEWVNRFIDSQKRWNNRLFKKSLVLLHDFSLLQSVAQDSDGYIHASLHPLVKDWIQLQMGKFACQQYALMVTEILGNILYACEKNGHYQLPLRTKQYLGIHITAQEDNNSEFLGINCAELHQDLIIEYATNQRYFAGFLTDLGLYDKAELLQVQVMETRQRVLGAEHLDTLTSINDLATTYWNQGRLEEAESLDVEVLETTRRVLGAEHLDTLTSMNNLARTYWNQGRLEEAESLEVEVLETRRRVLGAEHPRTLTSMNNLATTYYNQGRLEEAESLGVEVLEISKRVLGAEHLDTLTSMHNLAFTWKQSGRYSETLKLMEECVRLQTRILGNNHPANLASNKALLGWQAENLEISSLVK